MENIVRIVKRAELKRNKNGKIAVSRKFETVHVDYLKMCINRSNHSGTNIISEPGNLCKGCCSESKCSDKMKSIMEERNAEFQA